MSVSIKVCLISGLVAQRYTFPLFFLVQGSFYKGTNTEKRVPSL